MAGLIGFKDVNQIVTHRHVVDHEGTHKEGADAFTYQ
jgi:hypothetical protein